MEHLLFRMINNSYATEIVSVEMEFKPRLDSNISSGKFAAPFTASALELYLCSPSNTPHSTSQTAHRACSRSACRMWLRPRPARAVCSKPCPTNPCVHPSKPNTYDTSPHGAFRDFLCIPSFPFQLSLNTVTSLLLSASGYGSVIT